MNLTVFFDVLLAGTCLAPGFYLVRTLLQIYKIEELSMLKYEWIPICMSGIFFAAWVIEGAYFDYTQMFSLQANGIRDATLFASVSIFAIGTARFADIWGSYVQGIKVKKMMMAKTGAIPEPLDERS